MKHLKTIRLLLALVAMLFVPIIHAQAQVTRTNTASLLAQVQILKAQLQAIEQQLLLRSTTVSAYVPTYTVTPIYNYDNVNYYINRIEVNFVGNIAQVRVIFTNGNTQFYAFEAYDMSEVVRLLAPELNLSLATTLQLITDVNASFNSNRHYNRNNNDRSYAHNVRRIDVTFTRFDAHIVVRFRNGTTDRFILREVDDDEDEVISRLANRYDMRKRDIEDVISFN